jgi:hypothetical protein
MLNNIKNKITENSGLVNMAINLLILFWLITVGTAVKQVDSKMQTVLEQTGTIQPVGQLEPVSEEQIRQMVIGILIQKLQEAQSTAK